MNSRKFHRIENNYLRHLDGDPCFQKLLLPISSKDDILKVHEFSNSDMSGINRLLTMPSL